MHAPWLSAAGREAREAFCPQYQYLVTQCEFIKLRPSMNDATCLSERLES